MREIEFRGKCVVTGEWLYGDLVHLDDGKNTFTCIYGHGFGYRQGEVKSNTIGQFVGAKDVVGRRIFEGDIVRFDYENDEGKYSHEDFLIDFANGAFRAQYLGNLKCAPNTFDEIGINECYVVGNKWDNPELLEVKK